VGQAVGAAQQARLAVVGKALLGALDGGLEGEGRGRVGLVLLEALVEALDLVLEAAGVGLALAAGREAGDVGLGGLDAAERDGEREGGGGGDGARRGGVGLGGGLGDDGGAAGGGRGARGGGLLLFLVGGKGSRGAGGFSVRRR
jgi:hypothetical protein